MNKVNVLDFYSDDDLRDIIETIRAGCGDDEALKKLRGMMRETARLNYRNGYLYLNGAKERDHDDRYHVIGEIYYLGKDLAKITFAKTASLEIAEMIRGELEQKLGPAYYINCDIIVFDSWNGDEVPVYTGSVKDDDANF